jgi:hypothetical protein
MEAFLEHTLMRSFLDGDFQKWMRMSTSTFQYSCTLLGHVLETIYSNFKEHFGVKPRIAHFG